MVSKCKKSMRCAVVFRDPFLHYVLQFGWVMNYPPVVYYLGRVEAFKGKGRAESDYIHPSRYSGSHAIRRILNHQAVSRFHPQLLRCQHTRKALQRVYRARSSIALILPLSP